MSDTPRTDYEMYIGRNDIEVVDADFARDLERQLAQLEKDAARYRWLRDWAQSYQMHEYFKAGMSLEEIDAAIDQAMQKEEG